MSTERERERAEAALERIDRLSRLLDSEFQLPGTRFTIGLDPLLGLMPVAGDVLGALLSSWLIFESWRADVPREEIGRMARNVGAETLVGLVPIFGDVFDFAFKANVRNARIARQAIQKRHFPELEDEKLTLFRQPRPLLIVVALTLASVFGLGVLVGSC